MENSVVLRFIAGSGFMASDGRFINIEMPTFHLYDDEEAAEGDMTHVRLAKIDGEVYLLVFDSCDIDASKGTWHEDFSLRELLVIWTGEQFHRNGGRLFDYEANPPDWDVLPDFTGLLADLEEGCFEYVDNLEYFRLEQLDAREAQNARSRIAAMLAESEIPGFLEQHPSLVEMLNA